MWRNIHVALHERAILMRGGLPARALAPGRRSVFGFATSVLFFDARHPVFEAPAEVRAVLPHEWFSEIRLEQNERALVRVEGRPKAWLRPGNHLVWRVDPSVTIEMLSVDGPVPTITKELRAILPLGEIVEHHIAQHERGIVLLDGRVDRVIEPGRYAYWTPPEAHVEVTHVDMRRREVPVSGQEMLTRDKVSLRLTLTNVIHRREETAATRQLANTARLLADNPVLMRMRELEMLKDIAGQLKEVRLVVGADKLEALIPSGLLNRA